MNYSETLEYLYSRLPVFQKQGVSAVNWKLEKIQRFCSYLGNPQERYKIIHVAGTNGKGSSSHYLASVLQESGIKTGLYTSPHLKDFRERFRVNGQLAPQAYVISFIEKHKEIINELSPSFFELTVAMSFQYFAEQEVEWAVVEVGLGGRLDSTNIVNPSICLITNIGYDHQDILGETLAEIAAEKAGIIKIGVPVVISERQNETEEVFKRTARLRSSEIFFAEDALVDSPTNSLVQNELILKQLNKLNPLKGAYQQKNLKGVLAVLLKLREKEGLNLKDSNIHNGIANIVANTQLKGRWQQLYDKPLTICDTGHNQDAFQYLIKYLNDINNGSIYLILGFAKDKDLDYLLRNIPANSKVFFTSFESNRSLAEFDYINTANHYSIQMKYFANVNIALAEARREANLEDFIFVGGSTYLVAEINEL